MNKTNATLQFSVLAVVIAALSGCGGGGGDSPPASATSTAEGLYTGTTTTGRNVTGLVLDDGTYYVLYSQISNANVIAGVVQGTGTSNAGTFSSGNARDFNLEGLGVLSASVSANYVAKQSLNGAVAYSAGGTTSFTSNYDATYEAAPSLAALAGSFSGQVASSAGTESATVAVSSAGVISGSGASGCAVSGSVSPRARGNAFNVSLTFGGTPCLFANQTLSGVAYFNSAAKRLYAAAPNASRSDGVLFVGVKP
jgi:hypothetical protein